MRMATREQDHHPMASRSASKRLKSSLPGAGAPAPRKKRTVVTLACDRCRLRRMKCDGLRPSCKTCAAMSHACRYDSESSRPTRQNNQALRDEVVSLRRQLAAGPHADSSSDLMTRINTDKNGTHGVQPGLRQGTSIFRLGIRNSPSNHQALRATLPFTETALEYELARKHPNAYRVIEPYENPDAVARALLGFGNPPCQHSLADSATYGPQIALEFCDTRLRDLQISHWSTVPVSNDFAASVISLYLQNMHPVLGTFDAELFVKDLVGHGLRYCSPFLVNAVLYYGCQSYTAYNLAASQLSWAFYAEAKDIWQASSGVDCPLHVAALVNMASACSNNGQDQEGLPFLQAARFMAERLGLDDDVTPTRHWQRNRQSSVIDDDLRFRAHVAWGYFTNTNGYAFYYNMPPTRGAGTLPIPGSPGFPTPSYLGSTYSSICKLFRIQREVVILYHGNQDTIPSRIPVAAMEAKYQQILALSAIESALGTSKTSRASHHAAILHIWYHSAIITLMRPLASQSFFLRSFVSATSTPDNIIAASTRQLKRLLLDFRLCYSEATYNIQWHPCLMFVANATLARSTTDAEWQFYFMACLYGYGTLSPAYRVAELCFKGLLTIAIDEGKMPMERARFLSNMLEERALGLQPGAGNPLSGIRLRLEGGKAGEKEGVDEGTVEVLAQRFEAALMFDQVLGQPEENVEDVLFHELMNMDGA
ncbi:hypothetical protein DOTSEDRAFT_74819 [Dothistroma septosporum NZE10]|uniref:Zn(2)-C6 fungal-type domain-containing protein n=1 Tax=Dothistroma septosporum (strain NZE10 / CBS 128990) TaxID=675120 RepID=N1PFL5_DOTSN|nr:hypothetical protein DOTSEDRAFT_74819 [Dothistroma septosporum NZE10]